MSSYVARVTVGFTVGGVIAVVGIWVFQSLILTPLGYAVGCAIGGASLGKGWRPAFGFGVAFMFPGFGILVLLMEAWHVQEDDWGMLVVWFLIYAIAGGIGAAISGLGWRVAFAGMTAFGVGGCLAFTSTRIAMDLGCYVGPLIPHVLGGASLAMAVAYPSYKRKKLGLCLKCGYDLRGSKDRCPECGTVFVATNVEE